MEEVNVVNNVLERAFNISPTTIYGFVVGLLFVLLVMQLIAIRKKDKQIITLYEKMVKLEQETLNANEIDLADKRKRLSNETSMSSENQPVQVHLNNYKEASNNKLIWYGTVFILVLLALLFISGVFIYNQRQQMELALAVYRADSVAARMHTKELSEGITRVRNELQQEKAEKEVIVSEKKYFQDLSYNDREFVKQMLYKEKITEKNLLAAQKLVTQFGMEFKAFLQDSVLTTLEGEQVQSDTNVTVQQYSFAEPSGWFQINGLVYGDSITGKPIITGKPKVKEEFDVLWFERRRAKRHFFDWIRKKDAFVQIKSLNPYVTTQGTKTVFKKK